MANMLSKSKVRVSYAEEVEVRKRLEKIAKARGVSLSDLIKEATIAYLEKHSKKRNAK